ncbi:hypothetical protein IMG5_199740 [Ichthyophthirius multifiliis]|uniref:RNA cytidine acetyltransferase n=1 Tax=Ichthyophthirius multifiliis TaxID=5932 RepID=G0R5M5_ICHMU|nr:hypothetical protein IMG5_199740 [Ichthyophthirius multifiliis]EGR27233.1 hypothetical protein IMG5_199740 [Ichthyophthirius multifiliis]|eukprot:XP_004024117.1 hypothetical protein IMG5_199740 [Ichthyophthirius multifiliis]
MRKKVDGRIQTLIENCIKLRQRGFFIIVGDKGREQAVNIHYLLNKMNFKNKPQVLWCYKKELGFSTHRQKRAKEIKKLQKKGLYDPNVDDPFQLFITSNKIRYCYYKETHKVLGQTFQLLVLQDFEAITPNMLCRTIETVEGGGFVILLLKTMSSLRQLYTLSMDVHQRFRSDQFQNIQPRFNERFILSLSQCENTIIMDDELNILPISKSINNIVSISNDCLDLKMVEELQKLKDSLKDTCPIVGALIQIAKTLDQAKCILSFINAISENKQQKQTISLTAGRGRGKSAAIGISIASGIAQGLSNIFVCAPSPENLKTLFEFIVLGLEQIGFKENMHYDIISSTNQEYNNAVIRINVFKTHKQVIQYVKPIDGLSVGTADLVIIDEAAAIPLFYLNQFLNNPLVFLSSTINGYEGTGRSLSQELIKKLKTQTITNSKNQRILKQITLQDPIRYSPNDPIEKWLNGLLCLEATDAVSLKEKLPPSEDCELFLVNRDTLFSYKQSTETYLFNLMSLFISSYYKNSPNDLQEISDSPSNSVFVLMQKIDDKNPKKGLPDILCAIQVCIEGKISKEAVQISQQQSENSEFKTYTDIIPYTITEEYQDNDFGKLSGIRIIKIATHPDAQRKGYGSKALSLLQSFLQGQLLTKKDDLKSYFDNYDNEQNYSKKPLLRKLNNIEPPNVHYLGLQFGLNQNLFKFWQKNKFVSLYLRQKKNELNLEHSCIMIKNLDCIYQNNEEQFNNNWLKFFKDDFNKRLVQLLSYEFKELNVQLCIGIIDPIKENQQIQKYDLKVINIKNIYIIYKQKRIIQTFSLINMIQKDLIIIAKTNFNLSKYKSYYLKQANQYLLINLEILNLVFYFILFFQVWDFSLNSLNKQQKNQILVLNKFQMFFIKGFSKFLLF